MQSSGEHAGASRFDRVASDWDANPTRVALARAVTEAIRQAVALEPGMRVLDFGAGTGLVTLGLSPFVGRLMAVDTSGEMLRQLDAKIQALGIGNVRTMRVGGEEPPLRAAPYDLVVSSMVLHHIADVPLTLRRLRDCLRPGGQVALADLEREDGTFHADRDGVHHDGFEPAIFSGWLRDAGFVDVASHEIHRVTRSIPDGAPRCYPVFLATGRAAESRQPPG